MKKLVSLVLLTAACSGSNTPPPAVAKVDLPTGDKLSPYDPAHPGVPRPQGIVQLNGKIYVTLANTDPDMYTPSGPGFLAAFNPSVGTVQLINLGGAEGKACQNPGAIVATTDRLYVSCGGTFSGDGSLVELDANGTVLRTLPLTDPNFFAPSAVAVATNRIWVGDSSASTRVFAVDRATFTLIGGDPVRLGCQPGTGAHPYTYVPALTMMNGDLWALCAADVNSVSTISQLDASTGTVKASTAVGPSPTALAPVGDGRIAVTSFDNTLRFVTPSAGGLTSQVGLTYNSQNDALQDLRFLDGFLYSVESVSGTVQKIDPRAQGGAKIVGEASTGTGANPWNILPLDDTQALVTNWVSGNVVRVTW